MSEQPITSLEDAVAALGALPMPAGVEAKEYGAALPWAALMDDEDLTEFLGDLLDALTSNPSCTRDVLVEVEKTCSTWRLIAEAQHAHNTAPGPDAMRVDHRSWEDPHDSPLHSPRKIPHDLEWPELGGQR